ncbi:MAG: hypothetical protein U5L06_10650 [Rhodovibrio sp.]|nr:hypothetical protein [Rhodovibrio sp.]
MGEPLLGQLPGAVLGGHLDQGAVLGIDRSPGARPGQGDEAHQPAAAHERHREPDVGRAVLERRAAERLRRRGAVFRRRARGEVRGRKRRRCGGAEVPAARQAGPGVVALVPVVGVERAARRLHEVGDRFDQAGFQRRAGAVVRQGGEQALPFVQVVVFAGEEVAGDELLRAGAHGPGRQHDQQRQHRQEQERHLQRQPVGVRHLTERDRHRGDDDQVDAACDQGGGVERAAMGDPHLALPQTRAQGAERDHRQREEVQQPLHLHEVAAPHPKAEQLGVQEQFIGEQPGERKAQELEVPAGRLVRVAQHRGDQRQHEHRRDQLEGQRQMPGALDARQTQPAQRDEQRRQCPDAQDRAPRQPVVGLRMGGRQTGEEQDPGERAREMEVGLEQPYRAGRDRNAARPRAVRGQSQRQQPRLPRAQPSPIVSPARARKPRPAAKNAMPAVIASGWSGCPWITPHDPSSCK